MRTQWIAIAGIVVVIIGTALFVTGALMTRLTSLSFIPRKICDVGHRNSRCQGVKYFALGSEGDVNLTTTKSFTIPVSK
jgi:hypothetical protein